MNEAVSSSSFNYVDNTGNNLTPSALKRNELLNMRRKERL